MKDAQGWCNVGYASLLAAISAGTLDAPDGALWSVCGAVVGVGEVGICREKGVSGGFFRVDDAVD